MCRPEIARELVIGVSTGRSHAKNIYGKLGLYGHVQAIERSRASACCPAPRSIFRISPLRRHYSVVVSAEMRRLIYYSLTEPATSPLMI